MTCSQRPSSLWHTCVFLVAFVVGVYHPPEATADEFRLSVFTVDVTIPLNHRCMGVLPTKSKVIVDPLYAHGFVLQSKAPAIVLCAVDWCEIRNDSYDQWRKALAEAADTTMDRVLVSSLHQHDAPVVDAGAERLLSQVGLAGELFDTEFHNQTVQRVAQAVSESLQHSQPITHLGMGQAAVQRIASNRRVVLPDGTVSFGRGSRSGSDPIHQQAPVGQIDPNLKTLSFWNNDQPVLALHAYATHPMSYYGRGEVTSDFVGLARAKRQRDDFSVHQIYLSGCSGDVTAGKFNEGTPEHRQALTQRLYEAMVAAWKNTRRVPLTTIDFRKTSLNLEMHPSQRVDIERLQQQLKNETLTTEARILAAMGLASHERLQKKRAIDFPCVDLGEAQVVLFPGEAFVGYQLLAQKMAPKNFVVSVGYGECWPGYIPTDREFNDGFDDSWLWAAPGSEDRIRKALKQVLGPSSL
jgi:hypothetical protein